MRYQSAFTWAVVAVAQVARSNFSAQSSAAALYFIPAQDIVLNRPSNPRLTNAYIAEQIASVPNMISTGRLPSIAMLHVGTVVRLTNTVEAPEAVTDSAGAVVVISSDWRTQPEAKAHIEQRLAALNVTVIGATPLARTRALARPAEIFQWLSTHPDEHNGRYVVLDDRDLTRETRGASVRERLWEGGGRRNGRRRGRHVAVGRRVGGRVPPRARRAATTSSQWGRGPRQATGI